MLNLNPVQPVRHDLEAIKRSYSAVDAARAAGIKLIRCGSDFKACCPFHSDRSPSFTIYSGGQRWYCFGCGEQGDVLDFLCKLHHVGLRDALGMLASGQVPPSNPATSPSEKADTVPAARAIWQASAPIGGTLAEAYLRGRSLHLILPDSLRFATLRYGSNGPLHPVLVASIVDSSGELTGIQRTYLNDRGSGKLAVPKPKLSLGRIAGGAVRLAPPAGQVVVTEGIEDALTLQQELGLACWAAAGAGMLGKMHFPPIVQSVAVGGDADDAGREAARKSAAVFASRGITATVFFPTFGKDFNAELMEVRS
jgi:DNA primase